jgi:hypothetical protein
LAFVAVGNNGIGQRNIVYSFDGINWFLSNDTFTNSADSVATDGSNWVATGVEDTIGYSSDGLFWNKSSNSDTIFGFAANSISWNGSQWIATGGFNEPVGISDDGNIWSATTNAGDLLVSGIDSIWNGSKWIVTGAQKSPSTHRVITSTDGLIWSGSGNSNIFDLTAISYDGSIYVVGGQSTTNPMFYSYDAITWSASTNGDVVFPPVSQGPFSGFTYIQSIRYDGSKFVAAAQSDNCLGYSTDGITWSASTNGNVIFPSSQNPSGGDVRSLTWNGSKWIAGGGGSVLGYSSDGITWSASTNGSSIFLGVNGVASIPAPNLYPPIP